MTSLEKHKQITSQDNEKLQLIDNSTRLFVNLNSNKLLLTMQYRCSRQHAAANLKKQIALFKHIKPLNNDFNTEKTNNSFALTIHSLIRHLKLNNSQLM